MNFVPYNFLGAQPVGLLGLLLLVIFEPGIVSSGLKFSAGKGGASGLSAHFAGAAGAALDSGNKKPEGNSGVLMRSGFGVTKTKAGARVGMRAGTPFRPSDGARGDLPGAGLTGPLCRRRGNPATNFPLNGLNRRPVVPATCAAMAVSAAQHQERRSA